MRGRVRFNYCKFSTSKIEQHQPTKKHTFEPLPPKKEAKKEYKKNTILKKL